MTFGGFVAISIYLPTLLVGEYGLTPADAGARAAGFVVLATLARLAGGYLANRLGGTRLLNGTFAAVAGLAIVLAFGPGILCYCLSRTTPTFQSDCRQRLVVTDRSSLLPARRESKSRRISASPLQVSAVGAADAQRLEATLMIAELTSGICNRVERTAHGLPCLSGSR